MDFLEPGAFHKKTPNRYSAAMKASGVVVATVGIGIATGVIKVRISWITSPSSQTRKAVSKFGVALSNFTVLCGGYYPPEEMWWRLESECSIQQIGSVHHMIKVEVKTQDTMQSLYRLFPALMEAKGTRTTTFKVLGSTFCFRNSCDFIISKAASTYT